MICKRRQTCVYCGTSRTRIRDIYAGLHDKTQSLYQNIGSHLVLCLFWVQKNPRNRLRFVNDSCIAWVTSILHFQRIRTKNHLPAEHGIRKHLQEISRRLDDDMTSILTILGIGSLLISDCPFTWCASTCLSKSHSASMAAKCAHQAEIVLAQRPKDRSKW